MPQIFCFIVEFRDPETEEVFAQMGRAETEAVCLELVRHEISHWRSHGCDFLNAEFFLDRMSEAEFRARIPAQTTFVAWQRELSAA